MRILIFYKIAKAFETVEEPDPSITAPIKNKSREELKVKNRPVNTPIEPDGVMWGTKTTIDQGNVEGIAYPGLESVAWPIESAW